MNLSSIVSNPRFMRLSLWLSQNLPEGVLRRLGWWGAGAVCRLKAGTYPIIRANLAQVLGPDVDSDTLERTTRQALYALTQSSYTLFRAVDLPYEELVATVHFPEETLAVARTLFDREGGCVLVFPHLGNYDLGGLALAAHAPPIQVITQPNPPPGFEFSNELRGRTGCAVTPLSPAALRQAIRHLRAGGLVAVAGDRPVSELEEPVPFFGRPARVPSGHIRLALQTGATVVIGYCIWSDKEQRYVFYLEPPLEIVRTGNRKADLDANLRLVLGRLEAAISRWPGQWQMFVPVWE
jgi:KDO2-lipid IV(A) lauroyltransferase